MNPKRTIVVCLDIDRTLINFETDPAFVDFNGSNEYRDASAWVNFLTEMKKHCEDNKLHFIVQIITAKFTPDIAVNRVAKHLHAFLPPLDKHGNKINVRHNLRPDRALGWVPEKYCYMSHMETTSKFLRSNHEVTGTNDERLIGDINLLPAIHLCRNNYNYNQFKYSKVFVMKTISEHFHGGPVPSENMFLLDDQQYVIDEILSGLNGRTPCYQGVCASKLYELREATKAERTVACLKTLDVFKTAIKARVAAILLNDRSANINQFGATFPQLRGSRTNVSLGSNSTQLFFRPENRPDLNPAITHLQRNVRTAAPSSLIHHPIRPY